MAGEEVEGRVAWNGPLVGRQVGDEGNVTNRKMRDPTVQWRNALMSTGDAKRRWSCRDGCVLPWQCHVLLICKCVVLA